MQGDSGAIAAIDVDKVARDAVKRIFERAEEEGRVIHLDHAVDEVRKAIRAGLSLPMPPSPAEPREWR